MSTNLPGAANGNGRYKGRRKKRHRLNCAHDPTRLRPHQRTLPYTEKNTATIASLPEQPRSHSLATTPNTHIPQFLPQAPNLSHPVPGQMLELSTTPTHPLLLYLGLPARPGKDVHPLPQPSPSSWEAALSRSHIMEANEVLN